MSADVKYSLQPAPSVPSPEVGASPEPMGAPLSGETTPRSTTTSHDGSTELPLLEHLR